MQHVCANLIAAKGLGTGEFDDGAIYPLICTCRRAEKHFYSGMTCG